VSEALTVKMVKVTLIGKGRQYLTCLVYAVSEISSKIVFSRHSTFGGSS